MARNYGLDMYNQLEELMKKMDKMLIEIANLKMELKIEKEESIKKDNTINELTEKLAKAVETINELQDKLDNEKSKNNKNSSNSSKPPSTDITSKKKEEKTGANQYNFRSKSNKKIGGQFFHKGQTHTKERLEKDIREKNIKVKEIKLFIKGNSKKESIVKYKIGIKIEPIVYKYIFIYSEKSTEKLPKEFQSDVTYDNSIKALSINLDTINVVSLNRQEEFFKAITNDFLQIGNGTLVNFKKEFSMKAQPTLLNIENQLLSKPTMLTDETSAKFNGKNIFARNYSNNESVIYKVNKNKGHQPIIKDNILTKYLGGIMADHDTTIYKYGTDRYECNVHTGRYLKEIIELVPDVLWPQKMLDLLFRINNTRKLAMSFGCNNFTEEKIDEYVFEYQSILELAFQENKSILSKTYRGKAEKLRKRLLKYQHNHLAFIFNFKVPFDNNLSESDLRIFKTKTKVSGGFRNMNVAQCFADSLSIVRTARKRKINQNDVIYDIFAGKVLFA